MNEQDMKQQIELLLSEWQDSQLNIQSEAARSLLAEAVVQRLIRTQNIKLAKHNENQ